MARLTKSTKQKLYFSVMIIAFSWMIIGDLVSFHLEIFLGENKNHWHHPFAKTQKSDSKTYKIKSHKADGYSKSKHLAFIGEKPVKLFIVFNEHSFYNSIFRVFRYHKIYTLFLRGPPAIS